MTEGAAPCVSCAPSPSEYIRRLGGHCSTVRWMGAGRGARIKSLTLAVKTDGKAFRALDVIQVRAIKSGSVRGRRGSEPDRYTVEDIGDGYGVVFKGKRPLCRLLVSGNGLAAKWGGFIQR